MAQQSLHSLFEAAIIISSLAALLRDFNPILIVFGALAIGLIFLRPEQNAPSDQIFVVYEDAHVWWKTAAVGMVVLAIVVTAALSQNTLGRLSLSLFKTGSIAFGNGAAILPLIEVDVVDTLWLIDQPVSSRMVRLGADYTGTFFGSLPLSLDTNWVGSWALYWQLFLFFPQLSF